MYITTVMRKSVDQKTGLIDIFIGLAQASRCCRQDAAFCEGVTFHQFVILDAVVKNRELRIADVHTLLAVEKSTTTRLLNPLLAKGLLTKERSQNDSRAFVLALTRSGSATHRRVQICLEDFFNKVAGNLPAGEEKNILQAAQTLITAIRKASGPCACCQ